MMPFLLLGLAKEGQSQQNKKSTSTTASSPSTSTNAKASSSKQDLVFLMVDHAPQFPGGHTKMMNFIMNKCNFPPETEANPLVGKMIVQFIVERDGSLRDIKIVQGISTAYDKECQRVFGIMPKWNPGKDKGRLVRTLMVVPIKFSHT